MRGRGRGSPASTIAGWHWIVTSIVPRFRRFDADTRLAETSLRRIFDEARDYASNPCVLPRSPQTNGSAPDEE